MTHYVGRANGRIVSATPQAGNPDCPEPIDDAAPGLVAFLNPPPAQVSRLQAMVALSDAGLLSNVQAWVAGQDELTQLIWSSATMFSRSSALLARAAAALALTAAQLDQLFAAAANVDP
jgi:hypothetical protein